MGYLGKISAIVSANTGDFKPKLDAAAKDVTAFAKSMQSTLSSASSASSAALRSIYTEAQKFDRALSAAASRKLAFKGFDAANLDAGVTKAKQLYSVTAEITKPLAAAAKEFGKLSADVQGSFLPALIESQMAAEHLAAAIDKTGSVGEARFDRIKKKVDGVIESMTRIRSAEGLAGTLAAGRELAFQQPAMVSEVSRSRNLQARALALGPESLAGSRVADLVGQQKAAADEATRLYSVLEMVRRSRNGDSAAAEAALNNQLALYAQVNSQIEREISGLESAAAARKKASDPQRSQDNEIALLQRRNQAEKEAESARLASVDRASQNEIALLQRRHQTEREIETSRLAAVARAEQNETALLQRRYQAEKEAETARLAAVDRAEENEVALLQRRYQAEKEAETARLAAVDRAEENEIALLQRRYQAERDIESVRLAAAARAEENEIALLQRRHQAERDAERQRLSEQPVPIGGNYFADNLERQARGRMGGDVFAVGSRFDIGRQVDGIIGRVAAARSQLESLPEPIRAGLIPSLQRATESAATLARAGFGATADQIRNATAEAARFEQRVARSQRATNFSAQFGGPVGGEGLDFSLQERSLRAYSAQLDILHQTLSSVSASARGPAAASFDRLRVYISQAFTDGRLDAAGTRAEIQRLTRDAVAATAAVSGVRRGTLGRQVSRAGDIGRAGFGNAGLAIQQASFAVSDFMSSTGGLEFKVRAISNNIEQLGFVLFGTYGLVAAVGVSVATNVGIMAAKFMGLMDTEEQAKAATDALNDSLMRQKDSVKELADSYSNFSEELRKAILTKEKNLEIDRKNESGTVAGQQRTARRDAAAAILPEVFAAAARRKEIEERKPATIQEMQAKQAALQGNTRRSNAALDRNQAEGERSIRQMGPAGVVQMLAAETERRESLLRRRGSSGADTETLDNQLAGVNRNIAAYQDAVQTLKDSAAAAAMEGARPLGDAIEKALSDAAELKDELASLLPPDAVKQLSDAGEKLKELVDDAQGGKILGGESVANRLKKIQEEVAASAGGINRAVKSAPDFRLQQERIQAMRDQVISDAEARASRGRELMMTPGQKSAEQLLQAFKDIDSAVANPEVAMEAKKRTSVQEMRQSAPAIFNLSDQVQNAIMQGPSRAALQANDVTTTQGASELNRLLRGDDAAKNQDLVELQKQSKALDELVNIAKQNGAPPGIFDF